MKDNALTTPAAPKEGIDDCFLIHGNVDAACTVVWRWRLYFDCKGFLS
jgi:hypothetical protein